MRPLNRTVSPRSALGLCSLLGLAAVGCQNHATPKPAVLVVVHVFSVKDVGVGGAEVQFNGQTIATTDDKGNAKLSLQGSEGDSYDVTVSCPRGYHSPTQPLRVTLHRLDDPNLMPEYEATCPPSMRTAVVGVRAENGPNLPITFLNRVVGRTDGSGAATLLFPDVDANATIDLTLDTSSNPGLHPESPHGTFTLHGADDYFTFETKLVDKTPPKRAPVIIKDRPTALPTRRYH